MSASVQRKSGLMATSAMIVAAALLAQPGLAQSTAAPNSPAADETQTGPNGKPQLEDIVVTADRIGTNLVQVGSFRGARQIDTPLTISVIPETLIKDQQASSLLDALRNTPGVTSSQTSPTVYDNLSIRGIPVDNRENFRLNGVLPIVNLIDLPLEDKARVEALKGASALYYGFTTPSGIINLTTKAAPNDPVFDVTVDGNDHGQVQGHLDAGDKWGPFGVRFAASGGSVDSGIDNTTGYRDFQSGRFEFAPTSKLQMSVDVEHIYKKVTEPTVVKMATSATQIPYLPDPSTNPGAKYFYATAEEVNLLGHLAYSFSPSWNITLDAGQSRETRDRNFTYLNNFNPVTGNGTFALSAARGQVYRNVSFRGELNGTFSTGPVVHEIMAGASQNRLYQYSPSPVGLTGAGCTQIGLPATCVQNYYNPVALGYLPINGNTPYNASRDTEINDVGYYAFDRMKFGGPSGDLISVLLGGRKAVYRESSKAKGRTYAANPFSYSVGLVLKPRSWISGYGTYIEGLESTPAAPLTAVNAGQTLGPSKSKQYEGGIKIQPHKGLLFTASYFDIRRELTYTTLANVYVKDGRATYRGFEASLSGQITPELSVYASALFLSAKQGQTSNPALIGNRIENTAKTTWSVFGAYKLDRFVQGLAVNAGAYYVGNRAINPQNTLFLPGYTLFDVGGSYTTKLGERPLTFRVNARNVGNKRYFASTGGNYVAFGTPEQIKFSVSLGLF